jgi:all-trans-retinol 13,14-reductase
MAKADRFDAIVAGSGIGGLTAAAALAKHGRRVLVLERHTQLGGLTQTFSRGPYRFAVGVHYIGGVGEVPGPGGEFGRLLAWLSEGRLQFAPIGSPFDVVRLPGREFPFETPAARQLDRFAATFPRDFARIERFVGECEQAKRASRALFAANAVPPPLAAVVRFANHARLRRAISRTVAQAVADFDNRELAALLSARWGDYGVPPDRAPLLVHAAVLGSFDDGAYYPIGGAAAFAAALGETIVDAGGELRTGAQVSAIRIEGGRAAGVRLASGEELTAPLVISDMGARNTAAALPEGVAPAWRETIAGLESGLSYVSLYIGLRGDIRAHGATAANVWIYESNDVGRVWEHPADEEAPGLFVSFSTLKDPAHRDVQHHTAEVTAFCRWSPFAAWAKSSPGDRPEEYEALKAWAGTTLLAQFKRHFPRLAPLVDFYEVSTPLSQAFFDAADRGAAYGLELGAARLAARDLRQRTPVSGLLLAGQDATSLGVQGASLGGFMAAATVEPRLWRQL